IRPPQRSRSRVAIPSAVAAAAVLIVGVAVALPRGGDPGTPSGGGGTAFASGGVLKPFNSCDTVLEYFKDQAPEYLIERARGGVATTTEAGAPERTTAVPKQGRAADSSGTTAESSDHSTTNVQEAGVDEPDIVKTDGNRIVAVA